MSGEGRVHEREGTVMREELVVRFFAALEDGDLDALREIYAPDAVIWHNDDLIEQPIEEYLDSGKRAAIRAAREALSA